mgnify:CR=1 FL=1
MLLGALLLAVPASSAEKVIVISDSLVANADRMKASRGPNGWATSSGASAITPSRPARRGGRATDTKTNFWKTKTESKSVQKFSFTLGQRNHRPRHGRHGARAPGGIAPSRETGAECSFGKQARESDKFLLRVHHPHGRYVGSVDAVHGVNERRECG